MRQYCSCEWNDKGDVLTLCAAHQHYEAKRCAGFMRDLETMKWQPVETAPKGDGRDYVILYDKHVCVGVWFEDRWKPIHSTESVHPTHWMPLPPKPTK